MEDPTFWDVCLNQCLAAIRFIVIESTEFTPFFSLYNRDVVFPLANLLKPRRKYMGKLAHKIQQEIRYKSFILGHARIKAAKKRQARYADEHNRLMELDVYLGSYQRHSKLDI